MSPSGNNFLLDIYGTDVRVVVTDTGHLALGIKQSFTEAMAVLSPRQAGDLAQILYRTAEGIDKERRAREWYALFGDLTEPSEEEDAT